MKITVANPIYDSVFKFLMEDERIARTVLSALLKKEVESVEMRRHEHPNITRDKLSMFRIDFAARIREDDGSLRLVLIELQKTWLDTETLRFRRYLAAQYNSEENIQKKGDAKGFALPMIAVYLLGHRVGDIEEPVVYVSHKTLDYNGEEVKNGNDDPFISSLTHDSIIVQIPLLHGKINNRLDKVLSVFNQSQRTADCQQTISLEENLYENDPDMMHILRRLSLATMSAEVRQEMNDEDEFYSVIEARDTQVMKQSKIISDQKAQISDQKAQISDQKAQISDQKAQISDQKAQISDQKAQISDQKAQISDQKAQISDQKAQISDQKAQISDQKAQISDQKAQISDQKAQISDQKAQISDQKAQISDQKAQIKAMAQAMLKNGLSIAVIAGALNKSIDETEELLR